jgi:WD40 repeat protein
VLACLESTCVGIIFDPVEFVVYSIGSNYLIRQWNMATGRCKKSYPLETRDD